MKDTNAVYINLTGYAEATLDLATLVGNLTERVYLTGALALSSNLTITYTGIVKGHALDIYSTASIVTGAYSYTVLGRVIPKASATKRWIGRMLANGINTPQFYLASDTSEIGWMNIEQIDLTGALTDAMVKADAAIAFSKMAALTADKVPVIGEDGKITASAIGKDKLTFLDVTSSIQEQLNAKLDAGARSLSNTSIADDAAITLSKLAAVTTERVMVSDASGKMVPSSVTATTLNHLDATSSIQTQFDGKTPKTLARGSIYRGSAAGLAEALDAKGNAKILAGDGNDVNSVAISGDCTMDSAGVMTIGANKITPSKVSAEMRTEVIVVPFSFESGHVGATMKIRIPYACNITHVHANIVKALTATDSGFLQFMNNGSTNFTGSNLTAGKLEFAASTPQSAVVESTVLSNNSFTAGQVFQIVATKNTVGGNGVISITLERT